MKSDQSFRDFIVRIGHADIVQGKFTGKVFIYFNNKGLNFNFLNARKKLNFKFIKDINFTKHRQEKIIKGSALAKFFMFWVAFNGQNDSRQLAVTYTMGQFSSDKRGFENIFLVNILTKTSEIKIKVNQEQALLIGQAYNNPKLFFDKALNSRSFDKPILFFRPKWYLWTMYWFVGIMYIISNNQNNNMHEFLSLFFIILVLFPFGFKFFSRRVVNNKIHKYKKTEEYSDIISQYN